MPLDRTQHIRSVPFSVHRRAVTSGGLLVEGVAYPALRLPAEGPVPVADATLRIDSYRTWMDPATLERLAHDFLRYGRRADSDHDHADIGEIVESFVTREPLGDYPADVWVAKVLVSDPETAARVQSEELTGFSIEVVAGMEKVTLDVAGVGAVKTGRFVDPLPLFLSLVERPAIGIPFASVEDGAPEARSIQTRELRVTHLVRCAGPVPHDEEPMPPTTTPETETPPATASIVDAVQTPPALEEPAAPVQREPETTPANRMVARLVSRVLHEGDVPDDQFLRGIAKRFESTETRASTDYTDFASIWAEIGEGLTAWQSIWAATMIYEHVLEECRYGTGLTPESFAAMAKAAGDYAAVVVGVVGGMNPAAPEARSEPAPVEVEQRAGKKISAARLTKIKAAREACATGAAHLDELIGEVEGGEVEAETDSEERSALVAAERQLASLRDELTAQTTARTQAQADLAAATEARDAAQAKVQELETRRPARRGGEPEHGAETEPKATQRGFWAGTLFPGRPSTSDDE